MAGRSGVCSPPGIEAAASLLASWSWCQTLRSRASCRVEGRETRVHAALPQDRWIACSRPLAITLQHSKTRARSSAVAQ